jgi:hypothetical protein
LLNHTVVSQRRQFDFFAFFWFALSHWVAFASSTGRSAAG